MNNTPNGETGFRTAREVPIPEDARWFRSVLRKAGWTVTKRANADRTIVSWAGDGIIVITAKHPATDQRHFEIRWACDTDGSRRLLDLRWSVWGDEAYYPSTRLTGRDGWALISQWLRDARVHTWQEFDDRVAAHGRRVQDTALWGVQYENGTIGHCTSEKAARSKSYRWPVVHRATPDSEWNLVAA